MALQIRQACEAPATLIALEGFGTPFGDVSTSTVKKV